jgi:tRNA(Ile2)-agmatinylcytidine synthase
VEWLDYPNLIRLNPGIPFRTRGNGAVALRFKSDRIKFLNLVPVIEQMIRDYIDENYPNTNPGFVIIDGEIPEEIRTFSQKALWRTLPIKLAKRLLNQHYVPHFSLGNGRGLIGALSAIGNTLKNDYTYEYLAYRSMDVVDGERGVDEASVGEMDRIMGEKVFSNIDEANRVLIEPHGPDPVLYGIRGETALAVVEAASHVKSLQRVERWMVFRTNQGTGEHLSHQVRIQDLRPYMAATVQGIIDEKPTIFEGGFIVFGIEDDTSRIDCVAYEPTKQFRDVVSLLQIGDEIQVHASVRPKSRTHDRTLNLEGLEVINLSPDIHYLNPLCPECKKRMKSAGTGKGFKCVNCGFRDPDGEKIETHKERQLTKGLFLPPLNAQRHLTRPSSRFDKDNSKRSFTMLAEWHYP